MTPHNLRIWALIQCELVRVEAMKTENKSRESKGYSLAYDESAFAHVAEEIARLAQSFES